MESPRLDREALINEGWQQGVIIDRLSECPESLLGYIVLSQSCDCLHESTETEPYFEVLPVQKILSPDGNFQNGSNPRKIHFELQQDSSKIWVEANITQVKFLDRKKHSEYSVLQTTAISKASLDSLILWRADRYLRPAFPDSFNKAFLQKCKNAFGKCIKKNHLLINGLKITLDHYNEIPEGSEDQYEVNLLIIATPNDYAGNSSELSVIQDALEKALNKSTIFSATCHVTSSDQVTLYQLESNAWLDFKNYDYLSFANEN